MATKCALLLSVYIPRVDVSTCAENPCTDGFYSSWTYMISPT